MTKEKIAVILENHRHWLYKDVNGWETMRADLRDANLEGADLINADLRGANLEGADLRDANLINADLINADLEGADLRDANLKGANLINADLINANLEGADLINADLRGANLEGADLRDANLKGANLINADLEGANIERTEINHPIACPEEGSFIAWKKARAARINGQLYASVVIKLLIPEDAKRSSATTRKCRASKAVVLEGYVLDNPELKLNSDNTIHSMHNMRYTYKIGDVLEVLDFDENRWNECAPGIHFFITREEAEEYC